MIEIAILPSAIASAITRLFVIMCAIDACEPPTVPERSTCE